MKKRNLFLITCLLLMAGMQTAHAQRMIVSLKSGQYAAFNVEDVENVKFDSPHEFVDLGLPSGTMWATSNIGADSPEEAGDFYAWGETVPKDNYTWGTYIHCKGSSDKLTKYCTSSYYGYNGFTDNLTSLKSEDDVATAACGTSWSVPTDEQFNELINSDYTTKTWTTAGGFSGWKIKSKSNGKSIFLPAAGYREGTSLVYSGDMGCYWSSSLAGADYCANLLFFNSGSISTIAHYRCYGSSIRPVRDKHQAVDLGLPSGTLWATCNVGADSPEEFGDYFAWGETKPKSEYSWETYKYCKGTENTLTKYCADSSQGYNGFTDNLSELLPEDDAATANWGSQWQMPDYWQIMELRDEEYTTLECTTLNGVNGVKVKSKINGNSIFLPVTYYYEGTSLIKDYEQGVYWTSSYVNYANDLVNWICTLSTLDSSLPLTNGFGFRYFGQTVRPVRKQ